MLTTPARRPRLLPLPSARLAAMCAAALLAAAACGPSDAEPTPDGAPEPAPVDAGGGEPATPDDGDEPAFELPPAAPSGRVGGAVNDAAPEFAGIDAWLNSDPLTMEALRGDVVLIDFWTYTCINCIRTLPYLQDWHEKYDGLGLSIVGVHTPEFEFEKLTANVTAANEELGVAWPVAQDNDFRTWRAYNNRFWPAKYLIDANGVVRYAHFGEGAYEETEDVIRFLLTEAGADVEGVPLNPDTGPVWDARAQGTSTADRQTREIYGGWNRNANGIYIGHEDYYSAPLTTQFYTDHGNHLNHAIFLQGSWTALEESIKHGRETESLEDHIALIFYARSVNFVTDFEEGAEPYEVDVTIAELSADGAPLAYRPLAEDEAGEHVVVEDGRSYFVVDEADLYNVVSLPEFGGRELKFASNSADFALFALTFGSYDETY